MSPLVTIIAIAGAVWGLVADRIAARWPAHDDGTIRPIDWRTAAVIGAGSLGLSVLVARYESDPGSAVYLGILVVALVLLFATDLDQRLLPDVITIPIVIYAVIGYGAGIGPFVRTPGDLLLAIIAAIAVPVGLYLVSIPFGAGAIGMGDLKLLFGIGLLAGAARLVAMVVVGALTAAAGIVILLVLRRITLKSYVPYGPFLIIGAIWAITVSGSP
ncbi:MAG: A24 family peptidase [Candidatus Limnocylindrales bacterium]